MNVDSKVLVNFIFNSEEAQLLRLDRLVEEELTVIDGHSWVELILLLVTKDITLNWDHLQQIGIELLHSKVSMGHCNLWSVQWNTIRVVDCNNHF